MQMRFSLSETIRYCLDSDVVIFLDVRKHQYFCYDGELREKFYTLTQCNFGAAIPVELREFAEHLTHAGIIRVAIDEHDRIAPTPNEVAHGSIFDNDELRGIRLSFRSARQIFVAALECSWLLHSKDLIEISNRLEQWKRQTASEPESDGNAVSSIISGFLDAAPWFLTVKDQCLYRSLLLVRYLSLRKISADWIVGVRYDPFRAHCWVERNGVILNDHLENVLAYKKILVI